MVSPRGDRQTIDLAAKVQGPGPSFHSSSTVNETIVHWAEINAPPILFLFFNVRHFVILTILPLFRSDRLKKRAIGHNS